MDDHERTASPQNLPSDYCVFRTAIRNPNLAKKIGNTLIAEKLVASAHFHHIESSYTWKDKAHHEEEYEIACYTRTRLMPLIEKRVKELHTYELPQIAATPMGYISDDFAWWIDTNTIRI